MTSKQSDVPPSHARLRTHHLMPLAMGLISNLKQSPGVMFVSPDYLLATMPTNDSNDNSRRVAELLPWLGLEVKDTLLASQLSLHPYQSMPQVASMCKPLLISISAQLAEARKAQSQAKRQHQVTAVLEGNATAAATNTMGLPSTSINAVIGLTSALPLRGAIPVVARLVSDLIGTTLEHALAIDVLRSGLQLLGMLAYEGQLGASTITLQTTEKQQRADPTPLRVTFADAQKRPASLAEAFLSSNGLSGYPPTSTSPSSPAAAATYETVHQCSIKVASARQPFWFRDWWNVPILALAVASAQVGLLESYIGAGVQKYFVDTLPFARRPAAGNEGRSLPVKSTAAADWRPVSQALVKLMGSEAAVGRFIRLLLASVVASELRLLSSDDYDVDDAAGSTTVAESDEMLRLRHLGHSLQPATIADWEGLRALTTLLADTQPSTAQQGSGHLSATDAAMASLLRVLRTAPNGTVVCDTGVMPFHNSIVVGRGICMLPTELGHMAVDLLEEAMAHRLEDIHVFPVKGSTLDAPEEGGEWQTSEASVHTETVFINMASCQLEARDELALSNNPSTFFNTSVDSLLAPNPLILGSIYNHHRTGVTAKKPSTAPSTSTFSPPTRPDSQACPLSALLGNIGFDHSVALGAVALGMPDVAQRCSAIISAFTDDEKSRKQNPKSDLGVLFCHRALEDRLFGVEASLNDSVVAMQSDGARRYMQVDHSFARIRYTDADSNLMLWPLGLTKDQLEGLSVNASTTKRQGSTPSGSPKLSHHFAGQKSKKTSIEKLAPKPTTAAEFKLRQQREVVDAEYRLFLREMTARFVQSLDGVYSELMKSVMASKHAASPGEHKLFVKCFLHLVPPLPPSLAAAAAYSQTNGSLYHGDYLRQSAFFQGLEVSLGARVLGLADAEPPSDAFVDGRTVVNAKQEAHTFDAFATRHFPLVAHNTRLISYMKDRRKAADGASGLRDDDFIALLCEALKLPQRSYRIDAYTSQIVLAPAAMEQLENALKGFRDKENSNAGQLTLAEEEIFKRQDSRLGRARPWSSRLASAGRSSSPTLRSSISGINRKDSHMSESVSSTPKRRVSASQLKPATLAANKSTDASRSSSVVSAQSAPKRESNPQDVDLLITEGRSDKVRPPTLLTLSESFALPTVESRDGTPHSRRSSVSSADSFVKASAREPAKSIATSPMREVTSASTMTIGTLWKAGDVIPSSPSKPEVASMAAPAISPAHVHAVVPPWRTNTFIDVVHLTNSARQRIEKQRAAREGLTFGGRGDQSLTGPDGWSQLVPSPPRSRVLSPSLGAGLKGGDRKVDLDVSRNAATVAPARHLSHRSSSGCRDCLTPTHFKNRFSQSSSRSIKQPTSAAQAASQSAVKLSIAGFYQLIDSTLGTQPQILSNSSVTINTTPTMGRIPAHAAVGSADDGPHRRNNSVSKDQSSRARYQV